MAAKKKKSFLNREVHPDTESVAIGSGIAVIIALLLKTLLLALPLGLAIALAHRYGLSKQKVKKGSKK